MIKGIKYQAIVTCWYGEYELYLEITIMIKLTWDENKLLVMKVLLVLFIMGVYMSVFVKNKIIVK